jgi:hypothetical protein
VPEDSYSLKFRELWSTIYVAWELKHDPWDVVRALGLTSKSREHYPKPQLGLLYLYLTDPVPWRAAEGDTPKALQARTPPITTAEQPRTGRLRRSTPSATSRITLAMSVCGSPAKLAPLIKQIHDDIELWGDAEHVWLARYTARHALTVRRLHASATRDPTSSERSVGTNPTPAVSIAQGP